MRIFGDDADRAWRWFGEHDPYYGVLSGPEYRKENLTPESLRSFFETGRAHVQHVLQTVQYHFGAVRTGSCLDFGCGVGRLLIPFASHFDRVVGVDVSSAMIAEAKRNCTNAGVSNISFHRSLDEVTDQYDLVHTYIVLQHIPVRRGVKLIDGLLDRVAPQGAAFLHVSIGRNEGAMRDLATFMRKNVKPLHWLLNALAGRPFIEAYMQANRYDLNALVARLHGRGIRQLWVEAEKHGDGPHGVCIALRAP